MLWVTAVLPLVWLVFFILRLSESPMESYKVKQRRFKILIRHYLEILTLKTVYLCLDASVYICEHSKIETTINRHSNKISLQVKMKYWLLLMHIDATQNHFSIEILKVKYMSLSNVHSQQKALILLWCLCFFAYGSCLLQRELFNPWPQSFISFCR